MTEETEAREQSERLHMRISPEELAAIDDWRFANRVSSRSEAVRRLVQIGILASTEVPEALAASIRLHELSDDLDRRWYGLLEECDNKSDESLTVYAKQVALLFGESWDAVYDEMHETAERLFSIVEESEVLQTPHNLEERLGEAKRLRASEQGRREEMKRSRASELRQRPVDEDDE